MADLGDLLGSLMTGLIRARRMADEQTAALAEYYREQPLLEGLSVPRIRIPELTIDMPFIIDNHVAGEAGQMQEPKKVVTAVDKSMTSAMSRANVAVTPEFTKKFDANMESRLTLMRDSGMPVMKEAIARSAQDAFIEVAAKENIKISPTQRDSIAKDIRAEALVVGIVKQPVAPIVDANIKTADVKEKASPTSVVRLKITLKEEGLEWATQASESGGVKRTLQAE